ncbi:MAG: hypothetical protein U9Q83_09750 [Bacteroidota bacterium]|nr:hypothetical protein [Bacteroidota bacterium]
MNFVLNRPSPDLQIAGVFVIECYLIYMFLQSRNKKLSLVESRNTGTIMDNLVNFRNKHLRILQKEKYIAIIFGYFIISLALVQYFVHKGSILPLDFNHISIVFPIFLTSMLIFLPFILKFEFKSRYSRILEIIQTIDDLNSETE